MLQWPRQTERTKDDGSTANKGVYGASLGSGLGNKPADGPQSQSVWEPVWGKKRRGRDDTTAATSTQGSVTQTNADVMLGGVHTGRLFHYWKVCHSRSEEEM